MNNLNQQYMAEEMEIGYGYNNDDAQTGGGGLKFGANFGTAKMVKFEYTATGGAGGAAGDALDIVFNINGKDKSYRMFPVTKVYDKNRVELNPKDANFKEELIKALGIFNGTVTHILKCFVDEAVIKAAVSKKTKSFKEFIGIYQGLLPKNFMEKPLDIFAQWQWSISGSNNRTFLEIPKNVKHGFFVVPAVAPQGGNWTEVRSSTEPALYYEDGAGNKHPFTRSVWYMESTFAKVQKEEGSEESVSPAVNMESSQETTPQGWD